MRCLLVACLLALAAPTAAVTADTEVHVLTAGTPAKGRL